MFYRSDREKIPWFVTLREYVVLVVCAFLFLAYVKHQGRVALDFIMSWWAK